MPFGISAGAAALIGGGISAGGSLIGGLLQSGTASKANDQAQAALAQQQANLAPYRTAGTSTLQQQQDLLGLNGPDAANAAMSTFQTSPGYQFQLQQGLRATDAGAAASGMLRSGAALKAEQTFGQGLANQDFTNYYNRLMNISTLGENAAAGGAQTAGQQASAAIGGGNAQSSIYGNMFSGVGTTVNSLLTNPQVQSTLGIGQPNTNPTFNYTGGLGFQAGTSPGYGSQTFNAGGVF